MAANNKSLVYKQILEMALTYTCKWNLLVIPVYGIVDGKCSCRRGADCPSPGKHPRINKWKEQATRDPEVVKQWWTIWPEANIGLITGSASGLFVLDIDPRNGGLDNYKELKLSKTELQGGLLVKTGGRGFHFYYRIPKGEVLASTNPVKGVDLKGNGGFVVAPPSLHISGDPYAFKEPNAIHQEFSPLFVPQALKNIRNNAQLPTQGGSGTEKIPHGKRNNWAYQYAKKLFLSADMALATGTNAVLEEFRIRCEPPLDEKEITATVASAYKSVHGNQSGNPNGKHTLNVTAAGLDEQVDETWEVILADNNPPTIFRSGEHLVRLVDSDNRTTVGHFQQAALREYLARKIRWSRGQKNTPAMPTREVVQALAATPNPALPVLEGVAHTPVFDSEGNLISEIGYHAPSRIWFDIHPSLQNIQLTEVPTKREIAKARNLLLKHLLVDFPFAAQSDVTQLVGGLILSFVRQMIDGPTPIHLVEAASPGTGKTLLVNLLSLIVLGRSCEPTTFTDSEEVRKKITSMLLRRQPIVLFDNVERFDSGPLAAAITASMWSDRLLNTNNMAECPNHAAWFVTGNNVTPRLEMARRCIRIRLEANVEQPWMRTKFKHPDITEWTKLHRVRLVSSIIILIRAWIAAGSPPGERILGSFEAWSRVIGGILAHNRFTEFLYDVDKFYETADPEAADEKRFIESWWQDRQGKMATSKELLLLAKRGDHLPSIYGSAKSESGEVLSFSRYLGKLRGRVINGYEVVVGRDKSTKMREFSLKPIKNDATTGEGEY